jgi:integrase
VRAGLFFAHPPNEIKNLKVSDIDFSGKFVRVSGEIAKNHKTRYAACSDGLMERLTAMVRGVPKDYYLFGAELTPAKTKIGTGRFGYHWCKLRAALKLPNTMQLYSFRDTGIYEMLKSGVDDLTVMQHADHSSLNITTIYANHADAQLIDKVRGAKISF